MRGGKGSIPPAPIPSAPVPKAKRRPPRAPSPLASVISSVPCVHEEEEVLDPCDVKAQLLAALQAHDAAVLSGVASPPRPSSADSSLATLHQQLLHNHHFEWPQQGPV